uniref:hypothetical protein n=1 Tax=Trichocoleus desertorum TaxID=1481672 RepID=UPI0025B4A0A1|nr:hypothetical protein [Trichocoleus desertorum]
MNFVIGLAVGLVIAWTTAVGSCIWFLLHAQWSSAIAAFLVARLLDWVAGQVLEALK